MSVVRTGNKKKGFTIIDNAVLNDNRISYQAAGVLLHLLGKPPKWKVQVTELVRSGKNGKTHIYRILDELQLAGYVTKDVGRDAQGRISCTDYTVYEQPQIVDAGCIDKLTCQQEKRKRKKQANNRRRSQQPRLAKPDLVSSDAVKPNLAAPPLIKDGGDIKDGGSTKNGKEKGEPPTPAGWTNSLSLPEKDSTIDEDKLGPAENPELIVCPAPPPNPDPVPAAPVVAADAASTRQGQKVALPDPHSPEFPKRPHTPHPDWCAGVRKFDGVLAEAVGKLWRCDLFVDDRTARKYYNTRYRGVLTDRQVEMMLRFWQDAPVDGDQCPRSLWEALDADKIPHVLSACRQAVKDAIEDIRQDGETDDGEIHTLNRLANARGMISGDTNMREFFERYHQDSAGPLLIGYSLGASCVPEAARMVRENLVDELSRWPSWLDRWTSHSKFPDIFGLTVEEIKEHQRRFAAEKARGIQDLEAYL